MPSGGRVVAGLWPSSSARVRLGADGFPASRSCGRIYPLPALRGWYVAASVELIAYASRLGGDLGRLREILADPLAGLFGGVHVLPFYVPFDGADAGFDPQDHTKVDPRLGSWDDIAALARDGYTVMADLIVNHVSCTSPQFADWLAKGPHSACDGMFLTF